jgi:hypothetical protein
METIFLSSSVSDVPVFVLAKNEEEFRHFRVMFLQWNHHRGPHFFTDYKEATSALGAIHAGIIFISYHFAGNRGFDAARLLSENGGELRMAGYSFSYLHRQLYSMIHAGALSFFTNKSRPAEVLNMMEEMVTGRCYYNNYYTQDCVEYVKQQVRLKDDWWRTPIGDEARRYGRARYNGEETRATGKELEVIKRHENYLQKKIKKEYHIDSLPELIRTLLREDIMEK